MLASKAKTKKQRKLPILAELREVLDRRRQAPDGSDLPTDPIRVRRGHRAHDDP
jgi:hypothetical protein